MKKSLLKTLLLSLLLSVSTLLHAQNDSINAAKDMNDDRNGFKSNLEKGAKYQSNIEEEKKKEINYEIDDIFLTIYPAIEQPNRVEKSFVVDYGKLLQIKLRIGKNPLSVSELSTYPLEKLKVVISCDSCINPGSGILKYYTNEQRSSDELIVFDITSRNKFSQLSEEKLFLTFYQNNKQIKKINFNLTILPEKK